MDPQECIGQTYDGSIKSYSPIKGYGFISSPEIEGDLFFIHKELPRWVVNQAFGQQANLSTTPVKFTISTNDNGKPCATGIEMEGKEDTGKGKPPAEPVEQVKGEPVLDGQRVIATIKSYSSSKKWGFASVEADDGEFGDIFVHANTIRRLEDGSETEIRVGDAIEMHMELVEGKIVARDVQRLALTGDVFAGQLLKGFVTAFDGAEGTIECLRVQGEIFFTVEDAPKKKFDDPVGKEVFFRMFIAGDGSNQAKMINHITGADDAEHKERIHEVIDWLSEEGLLDEKAIEALKDTSAYELSEVLPELDFYKTDNPSAFILGSLGRAHKEKNGIRFNAWGKVKGKGKGKKGKGKGKGKRATPY